MMWFPSHGHGIPHEIDNWPVLPVGLEFSVSHVSSAIRNTNKVLSSLLSLSSSGPCGIDASNDDNDGAVPLIPKFSLGLPKGAAKKTWRPDPNAEYYISFFGGTAELETFFSLICAAFPHLWQMALSDSPSSQAAT